MSICSLICAGGKLCVRMPSGQLECAWNVLSHVRKGSNSYGNEVCTCMQRGARQVCGGAELLPLRASDGGGFAFPIAGGGFAFPS